MAKQRFSRKILHICIIAVIIVAIGFVAMMFILNYDVKGETNMPFKISKISIISSTDGQNVESSEYKWNKNIMVNNDIYIYVEKNNEYTKQETISSVKIDNFNIIESPTVGEVKIYKQSEKDNLIFENVDENIVEKLEFVGSNTTDTKNLQISNQGGVLNFRCAINNIGTYVSNDVTEIINHDELLKKANIDETTIKAEISFDITITLDSGKVFKAEGVAINVPNDTIVQNGTVGKEYVDLENIVFKRIEN